METDFKLLERKYKGKEVGKHLIRVDPKKGPIITELPGTSSHHIKRPNCQSVNLSTTSFSISTLSLTMIFLFKHM
jgi:hypothetical protein